MEKQKKNKPKTVEEILRKIEEKAKTGEYFYRGEPEHFKEEPYLGKVSSNLYRIFLEDKEFDIEHIDIEAIEVDMLQTARFFDRKTIEELEFLAEIQHFGGKTNLIDFTEDYLIALFMACNSSTDKDGRVIMQRIEEVDSYIRNPYEPRNRIIAQKSVFVRHPHGFIEPNDDDVINIPTSLKKSIQEHLKRAHGISTETIYNDIHGFIMHQRLNLETYIELYRGLTLKQIGDSVNG